MSEYEKLLEETLLSLRGFQTKIASFIGSNNVKNSLLGRRLDILYRTSLDLPEDLISVSSKKGILAFSSSLGELMLEFQSIKEEVSIETQIIRNKKLLEKQADKFKVEIRKGAKEIPVKDESSE